MSHTTQICTDAVVTFLDDEGAEQYTPHTMTAQDGNPDIGKCQRMLEAAEKMRASLVLASQTLVSPGRPSTGIHRLQELTTNVAQETWLSSSNRLSASSAEQPEGPLAQAGTMTPTSLSPPQSRRSSIAGGQEVYVTPTLLSESLSSSDNTTTGFEDDNFPVDDSESLRHSPGKPRHGLCSRSVFGI